ncbi:MAG: cell division protein ZapA [Firmicutes bacterium]|nr:cell division protein ZapA [Bacillota bacterium]
MTSYNTVRFSLEGMEFTLRGDKSPEQLQRIADLVCQNAAQIKAVAPNYSPVRLATLTALNLAEELLDAREEVSQLLEEAAAANRASPRRRRTPRREPARQESAGEVLFAAASETEGDALFPPARDLSSDGFFTRLSALPGVGLNPAPAQDEPLSGALPEDAASLFPEDGDESDAEVLFPAEGELLGGGFFTRLAQEPAAETGSPAGATAARGPLPEGGEEPLPEALFPDPLI